MGSRIGPTPPWLTEGFARYIEFLAIDSYGFANFESNREFSISQTRTAPSLQSLETHSAMVAAGSPGYALGFTAWDYLVGRDPTGPSSLVEIWEVIGEGFLWQEAFQHVFGRTVETFYEEFEEYRKANFPPWPYHVSGRVTDLNGTPISAIVVDVCIFDDDGVAGLCVGAQGPTGSDGRFVLGVDNGRYFLTFRRYPSNAPEAFLGFYSTQISTGLTFDRNMVTVVTVNGADVGEINVRVPTSP
jgi:hypothetical protein